MPVHVCVLTAVHQPFDGRIFHRECVTLAQAGYQVTLVAPADFGEQQRDGVAIVGIPRPSSRWQRPHAWLRLYRHARRLHPDVIHFHDPELLLLAPLLRLTLGRRVRIVYDVHEYFVDSLATKFWIPRRLRPLAIVLARRLERLLVRSVAGLVLAVDGQRPLYAAFRGPTAIVRNLPLATLFEGAQPHPAMDTPGLKLIYVGLLLPQRGIDTLLGAMRLLREQGVEDVILFLIGPETSPAYIREIELFARTHQIGRQVRWLGYVPHDQLKHYLANAHAGLAPSHHTRQYSQPNIATKLFEYMLCGLPVVTVDNPYWRVYVEESNCGLVVPAGDAGAHAQAILWLRDHPAEAAAMGQRGQAMVLDHYTWEQEQSKLLAFYKAIEEAQ
jgi:glycosyltransferase involved in cell wall biosynthesis